MGMPNLFGIVRIIAIADVLLAATQITIYVYLMAEKLPELELVPGSKAAQFIDYAFVSFTCTVQILAAFKFYLVLTRPREPHEVEELLRISVYWMIASYILLVNWIIKAGIYSQRRRGLSGALVLCIIEVSFRVCSISVMKVFISRLNKIVKRKDKQLQAKGHFVTRKKSVAPHRASVAPHRASVAPQRASQ